VLVGGSTRTPMISNLLESRLGQPAHREVNPDLCVAMGAAIQGAMIAGQDVGQVLIDITPHSLGIKCVDGSMEGFGMPFIHRFAAIIKRNSPLPVNRSELFRTVGDNQQRVEIEIFQGESDDTRHNHRIGMFLIEGLAKVPAGSPIIVQLELTLDGILKVAAREKLTGLVKQITIENALQSIVGEERDAAVARLGELFATREDWQVNEMAGGLEDEDDLLEEDAYDDEDDDAEDEPEPTVPTLAVGPREGQREAVQARALLEKAARLRDKTVEDDRPDYDRLTQAVEVALTDRNWTGLTTAMNELSDVLFYLEDA